MSGKLIAGLVPIAALTGAALVIATVYLRDSEFRKSVDELMGWNRNTTEGCCGGNTEAGNCCVTNGDSGACCGGNESGGNCCDAEGGCGDGDDDCGDCGCGEGLDGHVLTTEPTFAADLEDMQPEADFSGDERPTRGLVAKRRNKRAVADHGFLPPIFVKTFGCSHNTSDSEFMAGMLASHGYPLVETLEDCELIVVNSCTVKNPSQDSFVNLVTKARSMGKKVVVAGCVPQGDKEDLLGEQVSAIGVAQLDRILEVVEGALQGNTVRLLGRKRSAEVATEGGLKVESSLLPSLDLPKVRRNKHVEIIPLSTGCLGACTYCKTKHARGKLGSYHPEQILRRVQTVLEEGQVSEIWMTSEDTGAYGLDLKKGKFAPLDPLSSSPTSSASTSQDVGEEVDLSHHSSSLNDKPIDKSKFSSDDSITNIADLLIRVTDLTAAYAKQHNTEPVMLRLGMTNPPYMLAHKEALAMVLNRPNVFAFLHIPVQSGSNQVLSNMVREYTVEDFNVLVEYLKQNVPHITLATDIICGFPYETEENHQETLDLLNQHQFVAVNISQFYPRAGTAAAQMKRVDTKIVKRRSTEVTKLFDSYNTNDWLEGQIVDVWFADTEVKTSNTVGHTRTYIKVIVPLDHSLLGTRRKVRVLKAKGLKWHVEGEVLPNGVY